MQVRNGIKMRESGGAMAVAETAMKNKRNGASSVVGSGNMDLESLHVSVDIDCASGVS